MKKLLFILPLMLLSTSSFGQDEVKEYVIEDDGSLSFSKVLIAKDGKSKEVIFPLIEAFFSYNYNDGKSVIQTINTENYYIIGSGIFRNFYSDTDDMFGRKMTYSTPHVIRIDCKDGKVRVIITVSRYDIHETNWMNSNRDVSNYTMNICFSYPIISAKKPNKLNRSETRELNTYKSLTSLIYKTFDTVEKTINAGNSKLENEEW